MTNASRIEKILIAKLVINHKYSFRPDICDKIALMQASTST